MSGAPRPWRRTQSHLDGVGAEEVDEVARATGARALDRRDAAEAEVVQLEADEEAARVGALLEEVLDDLLLLARVRAHRHRVPHLHEQRLEVVGQPVALGVGVLDRHEHVLRGHDRALRDRLDRDGQPAAVRLEDVLPALAVERARIGRERAVRPRPAEVDRVQLRRLR